jgi:hypothetical protein
MAMAMAMTMTMTMGYLVYFYLLSDVRFCATRPCIAFQVP